MNEMDPMAARKEYVKNLRNSKQRPTAKAFLRGGALWQKH
jgi:hypothetical protein